MGLTADLDAQLTDSRNPKTIRYAQVELLRQHLYGLAMGYKHQDDQDTLAHDVAMKLSAWDRRGERVAEERLASQPSAWRLIKRLSDKPNREALREALGGWIAWHQRASGGGRKVARGTIDIDPFPIAVRGGQEGAAWHGHYQQRMYYPLAASFSAEGDYESARLGEGFVHAMLRGGDCGSAAGMARFTRESIRKSRDLARHLDVRIDAGLVEGEVLDVIDEWTWVPTRRRVGRAPIARCWWSSTDKALAAHHRRHAHHAPYRSDGVHDPASVVRLVPKRARLPRKEIKQPFFCKLPLCGRVIGLGC